MDLKDSYLGIEFGSTRIKSVLIDKKQNILATGSHLWENSLINGVWTYSEEDIINGMQQAYLSLKRDVEKRYGERITKIGGIGISGMMHGYFAFDKNDRLLVPFRTWRNSMTSNAAKILSNSLNVSIPERYSISHLYQAILNKESHIKELGYITTISGYVQKKLTGKNVIGVGDGSGMFPIGENCDFDEEKISQFNKLLGKEDVSFTFRDVFPKIVKCGAIAGHLTKEGAKLLDIEGDLCCGIPLCSTEGDGQTGMVSTNCVNIGTGNVSAGTSVFVTVVTKKPLKKVYKELGTLSTPDGNPVIIMLANNCTGEINEYAKLFKEVANSLGMDSSYDDIYKMMFESAIKGDFDCGEITSCNYISNEIMTNFGEGRPLLIRNSGGLSLSNLVRAQIYSAVATLRYGIDILEEEGISLERIVGHGGYFKAGEIAVKSMSCALKAPISIMENAGEGGAFGMAVLACYMINGNGLTLSEYLDKVVFKNSKPLIISPTGDEIKGFEKYMERFDKLLGVERAAVNIM